MAATGARKARTARLLIAAVVIGVGLVALWAFTRAAPEDSPGPGAEQGQAGGAIPTTSPAAEPSEAPGPGSAGPAAPGSSNSSPSEAPSAEPVPGSPRLPPEREADVAALFGGLPYSLPVSPEGALVADGLTVRVDGVERIDAEAEGIGQVSGEALLITLAVQSSGGTAVDLRAVEVTAYEEDGVVPVSVIDSDPRHEPLPSQVDARSTAVGRYVFALPAQGALTLAVLLDATSPVVVIEGLLPADG